MEVVVVGIWRMDFIDGELEWSYLNSGKGFS
jgi:hypothetical protein